MAEKSGSSIAVLQNNSASSTNNLGWGGLQIAARQGGWRAAEWPSMDTAVQGGDDRLAGLNFFRLDFVEPRQVCFCHK